MLRILALVALAVAAAAVIAAARGPERAAATPPEFTATLLRAYPAAGADQGVAVDRTRFFTVGTRSVAQYSRRSGEPLRQVGVAALIHMDSGAIHRGRLYAAHSNYDESPMRSSVEVFDA